MLLLLKHDAVYCAMGRVLDRGVDNTEVAHEGELTGISDHMEGSVAPGSQSLGNGADGVDG